MTILRTARAWRRAMAARPEARIVGVIMAMKLALLSHGVAVTHVLSNQRLRSFNDLFAIWNRWDAPHYLFLAEHGYQAVGDQRWFLAFFPLFPWLVRTLAPVCSSYLAAALAVSTVCSLVLGILMWRLAELDERGLGDASVWFLFVFPTAYFLHVGYTEGLFLCLTVGAFLAARHRAWWVVGLLAFLAGMARINVVVLVPALAAEAWIEYRRERRWRSQWLWLGTGILGFGVYLWLNQAVGGSPLRFLDYQREHWFRQLAWPWVGLRESIRAIAWRPPGEAYMVGAQEALFVIIGLVGTIACWFRLRLSYAIWMTGNWLMFASQPFVFAVPRFTLTLFPLFILLAELARRSRAAAAVVTFWFLLLYALFSAQFVRGQWAF